MNNYNNRGSYNNSRGGSYSGQRSGYQNSRANYNNGNGQQEQQNDKKIRLLNSGSEASFVLISRLEKDLRESIPGTAVLCVL